MSKDIEQLVNATQFVHPNVQRAIHSLVGCDKVDQCVTAYLLNATLVNNIDDFTTVSLSQAVWECLFGSNKPMTARLKEYCDRFNCSYVEHTFAGSKSSRNRVTNVGTEHLQSLYQVKWNNAYPHMSKDFVHVHSGEPLKQPVPTTPSRNQYQRFVRSYLNAVPQEVYSTTEQLVDDACKLYGDDRNLMLSLVYRPVYESKEGTYRVFCSVWSSIKSSSRRCIYPHFVELDLSHAYLAILARMAKSVRFPMPLLNQVLDSGSDSWGAFLDQVALHWFEGACTVGVGLLHREFPGEVSRYLQTQKKRSSLKQQGDYPIITTCLSEQAVFAKNEKTGSVREALKRGVYTELFGGRRTLVLHELLKGMTIRQALAVYGSPLMKEIGNAQWHLSEVARTKGLVDAFGNVVQVSTGRAAVSRPVRGSQVVHDVASSWECLLMYEAFLEASRRPQTCTIALHQHDGVAVVAPDEDIAAICDAVTRKARSLGVKTTFVRKH